ncbi:MAG: type II toxin-antitoxin system mRNA interferase toxin, RelE/StbE family [Parcubacteria group bacterium]|nr:type II toxin-antitoxin system mRNA interferase toxin, RelE/StbE family [Parcubacteria group bacterium]MBI3075334.1 type II toxin-antitoxin system mRNA interferase toxin, RelE/StbE family [Parcubacteria group bacterium]
MKVLFKPTFVRQFDKLEVALQEEIEEKIELFKDRENHKLLKVHKLHGRLVKWYSFSVNYKMRIIFSYLSEQEVVLLAIGDHKVYDE